MDLSKFGFRKTPFTRELSSKERWTPVHQNDAIDELQEAVMQRMSCALIAPSGSGKTVALRTLIDRLPEARYQPHYVKVTGLSKRDLCKEIACACGLEPAGIYPALVRKLQESFLYVTSTDSLRPVLILDEAHDLRLDSLAMLRILTNFEMDSKLVLSVVLAGQPPLRRMLARTECEAVAQRLAHYATLRLLSREETQDYIVYRCRLAGAKSDPFDTGAHEAIFEMSHGNFRAIDRLCLKSLQIASKAGASAVSSAEIIAARHQLWP